MYNSAGMKGISLNAALISVLLLWMLVGVQFINKAKAETLGPPAMLNIDGTNEVAISSPQNTIYNESSILLNFTVKVYGSLDDVGYSLDGGAIEKVNTLVKIAEEPAPWMPWPPYVGVTYMGSLILSDLSNGNHSVTVYQGYQYQGTNKRYEVIAYAYANFTVDDVPPVILVLSPETKVYNRSEVSLNFTVDEPVSQVKYSLDGQNNLTVAGNTTLAELSAGVHNVTVYARDAVGNIGASKTIPFTVANEPEPFPTTLVIASAVTVATVGIGLLGYFKKRNQS